MRPPVIPDHTLLYAIGRGAYGEVWLARNVMGSPRAVKVIWRHQFESARPFEREFEGIRRYEPISRTSGGLVHVLHVGRNDAGGYFYYVMELADDAEGVGEVEAKRLVPGTSRLSQTSSQVAESHLNPPPERSPPLDVEPETAGSYRPRTLRSDLKSLQRLPTPECLRLAMDLASGLAALHRYGLVHRDVKPGNIIYVNGRAKLADIGLVTTEGEGRTFVGTEGYVPPEGPGSPAADLYALGVVLYEASTGLAPEAFPDVPPEWFTDAEGDQALEFHEIILKCCESQRERRYTNAEAMQADLALLQSGQSVRRMRALQLRYARLRMSGIVGTTCLVLALGSAFFANYRARLAAREQAKEARLRQQAQTAEREAHRQYEEALYEKAHALVLTKEVGHRTQALEAIRLAKGSTNAAELRRIAFAALGLPDLQLERQAPVPSLRIASVDPSLDRVAVLGAQQSVSIYSIQSGQSSPILPPSSTNSTYLAQWSPDGRLLAIKRQHPSPQDGSDLELWDSLGYQLLTTASNMAFNAFSFHPKEPLLVTGHDGGVIRIWALGDPAGKLTWTLPDTPRALAYSPDGKCLAASYLRGSSWVVAFHDSQTGALLTTSETAQPAYAIVWHPRGEWVSTMGQDPTDWNRGVWLIEPTTGARTLLGRHKIMTAGLSFSPDGDYLMSCGWEQELICWDLRTRQRAFTCTHAGYSLAWSSDGIHCAMVPHATQFLQQFAFQHPDCVELNAKGGERLRQGALSADGRWLAIPESQQLAVWALTSGASPALLAEDVLLPPFFSADGLELFAVVGKVPKARLKAWHLDTPPNQTTPPRLTLLPTPEVPGLIWAGLAGDTLVLTGQEGVRLLARTNLANGEGRVLSAAAGPAAIANNRGWLAVTHTYSPLVTVYSLPTLDKVAELQTVDHVISIWFSPGNEELTVINRAGLERWNTKTWCLDSREPCSPMSGSYVLYAPEGRGLWRVTSYSDIAFCSRDNLEPILPLPANVVPLCLSPDGHRLAVSVDDQRVQLWDLPKLREHFRELGVDWDSP